MVTNASAGSCTAPSRLSEAIRTVDGSLETAARTPHASRMATQTTATA